MTSKIMTPEEYAKMHQKAFRVAFDFLNTHFPPEHSDEWWDKAAKDMSDASISAGENKLVIGLLIGILDYLSEEEKLRRETDETGD